MIALFNMLVKILAWPVQWLCFRTKVTYEDKKAQSRKIKGKAILVSNHRAVYDYAVFLFVFFTRTLRYQMAEVLLQKKVLGLFLKCMGGIKLDRYSNDFAFLDKSAKILQNGGVVGIFPESRLPLKDEARPLPFKVGAVYLAKKTGSPIIPIYTNGSYFTKKRARVVIGKPVYCEDLWDNGKSEKENLQNISEYLRQKTVALGEMLNEEQR